MTEQEIINKIEEVLNNTQNVKMSNKLRAEVISGEIKKLAMKSIALYNGGL